MAPDSGFPVWMKIEQACFGILLVPLAVALFLPSVTRDFRRPQRPRTDQTA